LILSQNRTSILHFSEFNLSLGNRAKIGALIITNLIGTPMNGEPGQSGGQLESFTMIIGALGTNEIGGGEI